MTLIAGFPYAGGILLCSDTEHSGPEQKLFRTKISVTQCALGTVGMAYVGNSTLARSAMLKCERQLKELSGSGSLVDIVSEVLEREYREKILGVASRAEDVNYWYDFLIAIASDHDGLGFYCTDNETLHKWPTFKCRGSWEVPAEFVMKSLYWPGIELKDILMSATYLLARAKQNGTGIGGPSRFTAIRSDGTTDECDWWYAKPYEEALQQFDWAFSRLLHGLMDETVKGSDFESVLLEVRARMLNMKAACLPSSEIEAVMNALIRSSAAQLDLESTERGPSNPPPSQG